MNAQAHLFAPTACALHGSFKSGQSEVMAMAKRSSLPILGVLLVSAAGLALVCCV